jgi:osmoprotectant transport system permease protein
VASTAASTFREKIRSSNNVAAVGAVIGLLSLLFGWLTIKPNRLSSGTSMSLWDSLGDYGAAIIIILWIICLVLSFLKGRRIYGILLGLCSNLVLIISFVMAGKAASDIISKSPEFTRVSLSTGILVSAAGALMVIVAARQNLKHSLLILNLISWVWLAVLVIFMLAGWFNDLSVFQEYLNNTSRFYQELSIHLILFGSSIGAGIIIGIPLGVWAARSRRANRPIFIFANITQTIPSLALFGLLIALLAALSSFFTVLQSIGIRGIGAAPALIALTVYALLPIIQNTYTGLHEINPEIIDAGKGMGMNRLQLLRRVEAPLAAPLILTGVRTAAVQTIGNVAVAALIGAGGLGIFIFQGIGQAASDLIILGAIPIILLAMVVDTIMQVIIRVSAPKGLSEEVE